MKGKLPRVSFRSKRSRTPSIQALVVIFVCLFILFLWLNFVLTQQIESIGREIQSKNDELQSLERRADAYREEISEIGSQKKMAERARLLGYQPQAPFFLPLSEPLAEPATDVLFPLEQSASVASSEGIQAQTASRLWLLLTGLLTEPESQTVP